MQPLKKWAYLYAFPLTLAGFPMPSAAQTPSTTQAPTPARPIGPCDIYAETGSPCVAAHSTTRALYAAYNGPLYQVIRQSDRKTLDIGVVQPRGAANTDPGGYADAAAQDAFCADAYCWISIVYDQSGKDNHVIQAPRGFFLGPSMGGFNGLPVADMAPITIMGHKAYGVFVAPGTGLRLNDTKGTAVDDQAHGQYWVIDGHHYNSGCCFDYGNGEIDSRDDGNGTMETTFYGNTPWWYYGQSPGPWIMTDQENNLVGCVNKDKSKFCKDLPSIDWRFVTATAKGKPHHWSMAGGDAQSGPLKVLFDGPRIDATYDPMRKQGAIVLGNGGDNSNGSQGTFYEGVMTAPNTYPSHEADQRVQANVVAAQYAVPALQLAPAGGAKSPRLQTFSPGTVQSTTLTFTNTTTATVASVRLELAVPKGWSSSVAGSKRTAATFTQIAPGASVSAQFIVKAGTRITNLDLVGAATWTGPRGENLTERTALKVRNVPSVKINEFRISDGSENRTNAFIELYNSGPSAVDVSGWVLEQHQIGEAVRSTIQVPAGTRLAPKGFYVFGLANSGLSAATSAGQTTVHVRDTTGLKVGDTVEIGTGRTAERRKIASLGTASSAPTTMWQPLPDGPVITEPAGSTNVPVASTQGFVVGQKVAMGHGALYPVTDGTVERFEVATITKVGKPGTQGYLAVEARPGDRNLKVTPIDDISVGDVIRLDIESVGHGVETVTVKSLGSGARRTSLRFDAKAGATSIVVRTLKSEPAHPTRPFAVGDKLIVGTPDSLETVTITSVGGDAFVTRLGISRLVRSHVADEDIVEPGTGIELETPIKFHHAANLPFSVRGTGISFTPAARFDHSSNEPLVPLGTGIGLDQPLRFDHGIDEPLRATAVHNAGFQGEADQWFGGPSLSPYAGSMILRNAAGWLVDSLNYGYLVNLWSAEGDQTRSGFEQIGCFVTAPGTASVWDTATTTKVNASSGRFPDGADSDSNCNDFSHPAATLLALAVDAGSSNLKIESAKEFQAGQSIVLGTGTDAETLQIESVGSAGATTLAAPASVGARTIVVAARAHFAEGQEVLIGDGTAAIGEKIVGARTVDGRHELTLQQALEQPLAVGTPVTGTGLTLKAPSARGHDAGSQLTSDVPTPGKPNSYSIR